MQNTCKSVKKCRKLKDTDNTFFFDKPKHKQLNSNNLSYKSSDEFNHYMAIYITKKRLTFLISISWKYSFDDKM